MPEPTSTPFRRHWRFYRTATGGEVVSKELDALRADAAAALVAEMRVVARLGLKDSGARHLRGDIWEVRADSDEVTLRALFAKQGRFGQVLLALHVFPKKTQQTPPQKIELAEKRLADWTSRGRPTRSGHR
ncbi:MAG: type II toxin-antitoxin system RelE/ParE family toxin [Deltaproteobacteria bacterium]|nr:type II toxin-antitoxin system RelE/ParE family toxin [Deltaproteobacteria bacterium]